MPQKKDTRLLLDCLTPREVEVLKKRFGLSIEPYDLQSVQPIEDASDTVVCILCKRHTSKFRRCFDGDHDYHTAKPVWVNRRTEYD